MIGQNTNGPLSPAGYVCAIGPHCPEETFVVGSSLLQFETQFDASVLVGVELVVLCDR
jgi:hypothetical protein